MKVFLFYFLWQQKLQGRRKYLGSVGLVETQTDLTLSSLFVAIAISEG